MPAGFTRDQVARHRRARASRARRAGSRSVRAPARRHPRLRRGQSSRSTRPASRRPPACVARHAADRPDEVRPSLDRDDALANAPDPAARRRAASRCRGSSDDATCVRRAVRGARVRHDRDVRVRSGPARSAADVCRDALDAHRRARTRSCTPSTRSSAERALARAAGDRSRSAIAGATRRWPACRSRSRTTSARAASGRPPRRACSSTIVPPYDATVGRAARGAPAPSSSARPTATSSRWARRPRTRRSARRAIRGRSIAFPAASSGGSAVGGRGGHGAARARLGHRRIDPPAGRALRRRRPQADLRPRVALRPDRVRLVARSDRSADAHGRTTRRSRSACSPAPIRPTRPARRSRCPTTRRR